MAMESTCGICDASVVLNDSEKSRVVVRELKPPCSRNCEAVTALSWVPVILFAAMLWDWESAAVIVFTVEFVQVTLLTPAEALELYCQVPELFLAIGLQPLLDAVESYLTKVVLPSKETP